MCSFCTLCAREFRPIRKQSILRVVMQRLIASHTEQTRRRWCITILVRHIGCDTTQTYTATSSLRWTLNTCEYETKTSKLVLRARELDVERCAGIARCDARRASLRRESMRTQTRAHSRPGARRDRAVEGARRAHVSTSHRATAARRLRSSDAFDRRRYRLDRHTEPTVLFD